MKRSLATVGGKILFSRHLDMHKRTGAIIGVCGTEIIPHTLFSYNGLNCRMETVEICRTDIYVKSKK